MTVKVLVVDDSALMRQLLSELLNSDKRIQVVGVARDPYVARDQIKALNPDVITLDIEMPRMDGLSFLEKLMTLRPTPVVVVSTLTQAGASTMVRALELGAIDCVAKPLIDLCAGMTMLRDELIDKVLIAASSRPLARSGSLSPDKPLPFDPHLSTAGWIVAVGASTGGVEALQTLLTAMPSTAPAILVTQHMPPGFTTSFARRLDERCAMPCSRLPTSNASCPAISTSPMAASIWSWFAPARITPVGCMTARRSPATGPRSTCCSIRSRWRRAGTRSASS